MNIHLDILSPYLLFFFLSVFTGLHPLIDGMFAVPAFVRKVREPFVERYLEYFTVDEEGGTLSHHPDIMTNRQSAEYIDEVVTPGE